MLTNFLRGQVKGLFPVKQDDHTSPIMYHESLPMQKKKGKKCECVAKWSDRCSKSPLPPTHSFIPTNTTNERRDEVTAAGRGTAPH